MEDTKTQADKEADLQKRIEGFNSEFIPLLGKYKLGLGAVAQITPQGLVAARPSLFDVPEEVKEPESAPAPLADATA